tara:strand:+ start:1875 stop:3107 length:1233 start_codon:yes stop_codon:yes gene_type:complete
MSKYKIITKCQISSSKKLETIINLGFLPPVNEMFEINNRNFKQNFFNTELLYCAKSKLAQINTVVDKEILFPKSYPYTSSTTKNLRDNFQDLKKDIDKILHSIDKKFIIDIGSNDGNLLKNFKYDYKVLGITPERIGRLAIKKGIPTLLRYFDNETSNLILKKYKKANVITATNVFAHIDNPKKVLKNISKILDKDGIFVSESHYFISLIKTLQYDTIYHEHLRYYSLSSLKFLFNQIGFKIFDVKKINTHGGSLRVFASKNKKYKVSKKVKNFLSFEKKFLTKKTFFTFKRNVVQSKLDLHKIISDLKKRGNKIFGVSAPSRATTLINYVGIDENIIDCILEIKGSKKIGKYIPGTKIPIKSEDIILKEKPDFLLILSWHIYKEIIKNLKKKGFNGKFIIPLPKPIIIK